MEDNKFKTDLLFGKRNFTLVIIGLLFVIVGFVLMSGGNSKNPNVFNEDLYSFTRIRIAPTLVLIGFGIEVWAILANPNKK